MKKIFYILSIIMFLLSISSCARAPIAPALSEQQLYEEIRADMIALGAIFTNEPSMDEVDVDKAIEEIKTYLKKYPNSDHAARVHSGLVFIYGYKKMDYVQAIKECDKVIQNYPNNEWFVSSAKAEKARFRNKTKEDFVRKSRICH